jgi:transposase InsO family protein
MLVPTAPIEHGECTAAKTASTCRALGVTQSMGRVGCALDNAAAEAFNSTLKVEFAHRQTFKTRAEARIKISTCQHHPPAHRQRRTRADHVRTSDGRETESTNSPAQDRSGITPSPRFEGIDNTHAGTVTLVCRRS